MIRFYRDPKNTLYATSKTFDISTKCILRWAKDEIKIIRSSKGSKHAPHPKIGTHCQMEDLLHQEFQTLRQRGMKVKAYWFRVRAKQILNELNPEVSFSFSNGWFDRFKARYSISLRRTTNIAQRPANDKEESIRVFHLNIRQQARLRSGEELRDIGRYKLSQIANMDQTPFHSHLLMEPHILTKGHELSGSVAVLLGWRRGSALYSSPYLQMVHRGSSHSSYFGEKV